MKRNWISRILPDVGLVALGAAVTVFLTGSQKLTLLPKVENEPETTVSAEQAQAQEQEQLTETIPYDPIEDENTYNCVNYYYTITFPAEWQGKYIVDEAGNVLTVRQKSTAKAHPDDMEYGTIFRIHLFGDEGEFKLAAPSLPNLVFAKQFLYGPVPRCSAIQLPEKLMVTEADGEEAFAEYKEMITDLTWIRESQPYGQWYDGVAFERPAPETLPIAKGDIVLVPDDNNGYSVCVSKDGRITPIGGQARDIGEGIRVILFYRGEGEEYYHVLLGKDGKVLTPMKYNYIESFSEGLAVCSADYKEEGEDYIEITGHFGFLDTNGDEVIPMKFECIKKFSSGLAPVKMDGKWGFVDKTGTIAIQPQFDLEFKERGDNHFYKENDTLFDEGLQPAGIHNKYGYINTAGEFVIPPKWEVALPFHDGIAAVAKGGYWFYYGGSYQEGKWGLIDKSGNEIISPIYDDMYAFYDGVAVVQTVTEWQKGDMVENIPKTSLFGAVNTAGKIVVPVVYDRLAVVGQGNYSLLGKKDGKYTVFEIFGKVIVPEGKYSEITYIGENLFRVVNNGKVGMLDISGKVLVPAKYSDVKQAQLMMTGNIPGEFEVCLDGKWGIVNDKGKVLEPIIYNRLQHMGSGRIDYIKGYIDGAEYILRSGEVK